MPDTEPTQADTSAAWALFTKLDGMTDATMMDKVHAIARALAEHRAQNCPPVPDPVKPKALGHLVQLDPLLAFGHSACALIAKSAPGRDVRDTRGRCVGHVMHAWTVSNGTEVHAEVQTTEGRKLVARIA